MSWAEIASSQGGVISRRQLTAVGLDTRLVTRLVQRQELSTVTEAVYLVRGAPWSLQARLWAAALSTGGVLAFDTAAHLWGVVPQEPRQVHVCVDHARRSRAPDWLRLHRVEVAQWAIQYQSGLPLTSRAWTLLDVIGTQRVPGEASRILDRAIQRAWLTDPDLDGRLRRYPGRHGNGKLRQLQSQLDDHAAAASERRLHGLLRRAGITRWQANFPVWSNGAVIAVVDVALVEARIAIEIDGWAFHSDVDRFRRDRHRQNALLALGWTVLRFTWSDLIDRPKYVLATLRHFGVQMDAS